jgi:hypothetical protein
LVEALKEWAKLNIKKVNALIDSMPRRMKAVIAAEGYSAHYQYQKRWSNILSFHILVH